MSSKGQKNNGKYEDYFGHTAPHLASARIPGRHVLQDGEVVADELSLRVVLLAEGDGAVDAEVLVEEGGGGEPVPVGHVDGPVGVNEEVMRGGARTTHRDWSSVVWFFNDVQPL